MLMLGTVCDRENIFFVIFKAAVGPPSKVNIITVGSDLEVYISDPVTIQNTSMKEKISSLYFHIVYWERTADPQVSSTSH